MAVADAAAHDAVTTMLKGGKVSPQVADIWRLPGYGQLLDFRPGHFAVYDQAGALCWPDVQFKRSEDIDDAFPVVVSVSSNSAVFASAPDGTRYDAARIDALPAACSTRVDRASPRYVFDAVVASLEAYYPFAQEHHVDWRARADVLRPKVAAASDDQALLPVIAELFRDVQDPHTSLAGDVGGTQFRLRTFRGGDFAGLAVLHARQARYGNFLDWLHAVWMPSEARQASATLVPGTQRAALAGSVTWGRLPGGVGYLAIHALAGYTEDGDLADDRARLRPVLDAALRDLAGTRALVLDVSHDLGGNDEVAADVASRFTATERPAYSKRAFAGGRPQVFLTLPWKGVTYLKPVYLLTSELTSSAAEVLTMRMVGLPNVEQVGERTQGVFSDSTEKALPNGWILAMSTEVYLDADGRSFEGVGLAPSVPVRVADPASTTRYRDAILATARLAATHAGL